MAETRIRAFLCTQLYYSFLMPSFDIVSQVNPMEIENAVNQSRKELANRFDFKGSTAEIVLEKNEIKLSAEDQFKIKALVEIVIGKLAKRSISLKSVDKGQPDLSPLGHARQVIKISFTLLSTACGSAVAQVLFFDNFEQFGNSTDLTSTNYTPASGPSSAS